METTQPAPTTHTLSGCNSEPAHWVARPSRWSEPVPAGRGRRENAPGQLAAHTHAQSTFQSPRTLPKLWPFMQTLYGVTGNLLPTPLQQGTHPAGSVACRQAPNGSVRGAACSSLAPDAWMLQGPPPPLCPFPKRHHACRALAIYALPIESLNTFLHA